MKNKKSRKANLEKSRTVFMLLGLIIAIAFVVSAFQWQSEKVLPKIKSDGTEPLIEIYPDVTISENIEKPKKQDNSVNEKKKILDEIIISETAKALVEKPKVVVVPKDAKIIIIPEPIEEPVDKIWEWTSEPPKFPGGINALRRWIGKHVNYPAVARENQVEGTVFLRFEVTKTGKIGKVELQKGIDILIDTEAIKVIKKLPNFKPGKHNGAAVNVWFSIPISFKLN